MENNLFPPERSAVGRNTGQFTGKQTLYTPKGQVLHMHIHCTSPTTTGERNICIGASTQAIGGGAE